jgi:vacuolar-type H+-ATPase subunit I/STV1
VEQIELPTGFGVISDAAPVDASAPAPPPAVEVAEVTEAPESPLLAEVDADGEAIEVEAEAEVAEPTPAEGGEEKAPEKVVSMKSFKRRIAELAGQRETAKAEVRAAKEQLAALEGEAKTLREVTKIVAERFRNDPQELEFVDHFMAEVEARTKTDPNVKRLVQSVITAIKGKQGGTVSDTTTPTKVEAPQAPAESKAEKLAVTLIQGQAKTMATTALDAASVAPAHAAQIAAAFVAQNDAEALAAATPDDVIKFTREYLKANKISAQDVLKPKPEQKGKAKAKPATGGAARGGATEAAAAPQSKDEGKPKQPTTRAEFDANRKQRLGGLLREMGLRE